MKYPIDLGRKMGWKVGGPIDVEISKDAKEEKHYPNLHLEWEKPYDLPDEGVMTVRYKKTNESMSKHGDKKNFTVGLDILEILDTEAKGETEEKTTGDILDDYLEEKK